MLHTTRSEEETSELARKIAESLKTELGVTPRSIFLNGTLGAGKSVFARSIIRTLMDDNNLNVPSPTFTLVQSYDAPDGFPIHHLDLYRLEDPEEIFELGWNDLQAEGLSIIEWPEKLGPYAPHERIEITIESEGQDGPRHITIDGSEEKVLGL